MKLVLFGLISVSLLGVPQNPRLQEKKVESRTNTSERDTLASTRNKRTLDVLRTKAFAERASTFHDLKTKVITLSRIADLLWDFEEDFARQLFLKSLDNAARKDDATLRELKITARGLARIRRQIIGYISKRDREWAKRLIDSEVVANQADSFSTVQVNVETAYDLALTGHPQGAVEFAERSLQSGVSPWIVGVLVELRRKNESLANALFLKVLARLANEPNVNPNTLLFLGTYIFTSPKVSPDDPAATAQVAVGRVIVYDITADRPNIPPSLIRAYLQSATAALGRFTARSEELPLAYAAAYLILGKAKRLAPDLAPILSAQMQALSQDVPAAMLDDSTYKNLAQSPPLNLDESLAEVDRLTDSILRDGRYLSIIEQLWRLKDYSRARTVNEKVSDQHLQLRLRSLIDFGEGAVALERGDVRTGEKLIEKMPFNIERTILLLGVAHAHLSAKRVQAAADALRDASQTAKKFDDARRSTLLLLAAGEMLKVDPVSGTTMFADVIKDFNNQKPESLRRIVWAQKVEKGPVVRVFPLNVNGVSYQLDPAFRELAKADAETAIVSASGLIDEEVCANAMLAVMDALLKSPQKEKMQ